jgi:hypothetical protein
MSLNRRKEESYDDMLGRLYPADDPLFESNTFNITF